MAGCEVPSQSPGSIFTFAQRKVAGRFFAWPRSVLVSAKPRGFLARIEASDSLNRFSPVQGQAAPGRRSQHFPAAWESRGVGKQRRAFRQEVVGHVKTAVRIGSLKHQFLHMVG